MDPNAALKAILEAMRGGDIEEQYDAVEKLWGWHVRGGAVPDMNTLSEDDRRDLWDRLLGGMLDCLHHHQPQI